jgi:hypothetical protein
VLLAQRREEKIMHASECSTVNRNRYRHKAVKFNAKVNPRVCVFATSELPGTPCRTHVGLNRMLGHFSPELVNFSNHPPPSSSLFENFPVEVPKVPIFALRFQDKLVRKVSPAN